MLYFLLFEVHKKIFLEYSSTLIIYLYFIDINIKILAWTLNTNT